MSKNYAYLPLSPEEEEEYGNDIIYAASFRNNAKTYTTYAASIFVITCIPFILVYGIGLLLLLWAPFFTYVFYKDITTRRLFVTSDSIIYITSPPCCIPCFGVNKTEKHVLLSLVTDVIVSQGWYAGCWGLNTVGIENAGQGGVSSNGKRTNDLSFTGIENAQLFKKIILRTAAAKRAGQSLSRDSIEGIIKGENGPAPQSAPQNSVSFIYGGVAPQAVPVPPAVDSSKIDQLNETMVRIEQLLTLQAQAQAQRSGNSSLAI
ncbi:MAG: hypothetical protein NXI00_24440 [Cytophagales bacterium]|nr:hypothetical protein [Cytophagales bacterium]